VQRKPVLNYDFSLDEAAAKGGWQDAGRYGVWVEFQPRSRSSAGFAYEVQEIREGAFYRLPMKPRVLHMIPAGVMYRVAHLFAPWRISDADMIYLRAEMDDGIYHIMMSAQNRTVREDYLVWLCPACGNEMARKGFDTAREGLLKFWVFLQDQVRAFNSAPDAQLCSFCGHHHPLCYGFDQHTDTVAEAAARAIW
jgi:hypothetical protein